MNIQTMIADQEIKRLRERLEKENLSAEEKARILLVLVGWFEREVREAQTKIDLKKQDSSE